jgi:hypothetical protein
MPVTRTLRVRLATHAQSSPQDTPRNHCFHGPLASQVSQNYISSHVDMSTLLIRLISRDFWNLGRIREPARPEPSSRGPRRKNGCRRVSASLAGTRSRRDAAGPSSDHEVRYDTHHGLPRGSLPDPRRFARLAALGAARHSHWRHVVGLRLLHGEDRIERRGSALAFDRAETGGVQQLAILAKRAFFPFGAGQHIEALHLRPTGS